MDATAAAVCDGRRVGGGAAGVGSDDKRQVEEQSKSKEGELQDTKNQVGDTDTIHGQSVQGRGWSVTRILHGQGVRGRGCVPTAGGFSHDHTMSVIYRPILIQSHGDHQLIKACWCHRGVQLNDKTNQLNDRNNQLDKATKELQDARTKITALMIVQEGGSVGEGGSW